MKSLLDSLTLSGWKTYLAAFAWLVLGGLDYYSGDTTKAQEKILLALTLVGLRDAIG